MKFDAAEVIGATHRNVRHTERDSVPVHVVAASRRYRTTPEDLWEAVSDPTRLGRWFLPVSGELRVGGRYQLEGNAGGEILQCDPPRRLSVTWEFGGGMSWLDVMLAADGDWTELTLEHVVPDDEHWRKFGAGATGVGWDMALMGLGHHLATGEANDPAAAMEWMMSAEGRNFMAQSSEGWREAAVASGTPADEAAEAAAETLSFYTGETS